LDFWFRQNELCGRSKIRKAQLAASKQKFAMPPEAIARAITFAIEQPPDVDVNEMVMRPTTQI